MTCRQQEKMGYDQDVTYPTWETRYDVRWTDPDLRHPDPDPSRVQGCFKWTDSSTYFGDFKDNEIAGYGMYLGSCLGTHKTLSGGSAICLFHMCHIYHTVVAFYE